MIITKKDPYALDEIDQLKEVIDINKKICSAGCDRHFESEEILLNSGSRQSDISGGGIDLETKTIDFNSFINIRPAKIIEATRFKMRI